MNLEPTDEQRQIVDGAAAFLAKRLPIERLKGKQHPADRLPPALWAEISDMGWLGMVVPESAGGVGYTAVEEMLVFRELGRVLAPMRLVTSAVAAKVAVAAGNPQLARQIVSGDRPVALAAREDFSALPASLAKRRLYEISEARLALAFDGDRARLIDIEGLKFALVEGLDKSVSMTVANLEQRPVLCDLPAPEALQEAVLLTASMLLGQAELARDMITDYAKLRETFGRPIGAYQAVRHPIAEMAARCEEARSQLFVASLMVKQRRTDAGVQASMARVLCFAAALKNADDNIQLHGGIGVTDEFTAHFLLKRVHLMAEWFGSNRTHLESILHEQTLPY
jgi:alkylation response protein AidB-like acyl-CoA dehydrogenase